MAECFEGPDGLLAGLRKDSVWIDHSTTDYGQNYGYDQRVREKGAHMLESPVTGGMDALRLGQMATWVAGEKEIYEKVPCTSINVSGDRLIVGILRNGSRVASF